MNDTYKTIEVNDYQHGNVTLDYSIKNTSIYNYFDDRGIELRMAIKIGNSPLLTVADNIPAHTGSYALRERAEMATESMVRRMASFISKELCLDEIYLKHIKGLDAMLSTKDE